MAKYQITVSESQLETLRRAAESYTRICTGQLSYALEQVWIEKIFSLAPETRDDLERHLRSVSEILTDKKHDGWSSSLGLQSNESQTAYNLLQVIRHQRWLDQPEGQRNSSTVDSSVCIISGEAPAQIVKIDPPVDGI